MKTKPFAPEHHQASLPDFSGHLKASIHFIEGAGIRCLKKKCIAGPDHVYSMLSDHLSPANSFRVVMDKYFNQHLPILPDSGVMVKQ